MVMREIEPEIRRTKTQHAKALWICRGLSIFYGLVLELVADLPSSLTCCGLADLLCNLLYSKS